jgi:hypothetical protein
VSGSSGGASPLPGFLGFSLLAIGFQEIPWYPCDKFLFRFNLAQGGSCWLATGRVSCTTFSLLCTQLPNVVTWVSIHSFIKHHCSCQQMLSPIWAFLDFYPFV